MSIYHTIIHVAGSARADVFDDNKVDLPGVAAFGETTRGHVVDFIAAQMVPFLQDLQTINVITESSVLTGYWQLHANVKILSNLKMPTKTIQAIREHFELIWGAHGFLKEFKVGQSQMTGLYVQWHTCNGKVYNSETSKTHKTPIPPLALPIPALSRAPTTGLHHDSWNDAVSSKESQAWMRALGVDLQQSANSIGIGAIHCKILIDDFTECRLDQHTVGFPKTNRHLTATK